MADENPETANLLKELSSGISSILKSQEELSDKLDALEARVRRLEERTRAAESVPAAGGGEEDEYDYHVLLHSRLYTIGDVDGRTARMESVRRCVARRELPRVRTRYHTGSGDREVAYSYRLAGDGAAEAPWTPLEYRIEKGAGADYSAHLPLPEPIRAGARFELRHEIVLHDSFTTRNEWVTLVVEYPTDEFHLEVLIPPRPQAGGRAARGVPGGVEQLQQAPRLSPPFERNRPDPPGMARIRPRHRQGVYAVLGLVGGGSSIRGKSGNLSFW